MAKSIPKEIKIEILKIVEAFNEERQTAFQMTFRGQFAYLAKSEKQKVNIANTFRQMMAQKMGIPIKKLAAQDAPTVETKLGRLKYNGQMDNWSFAVFRYSREIYDAEEFMFPGAEELDGSVEGTLRAGMELYP
ncbi:MAG: hypothetical protein ACI9XO_001039 [Paraglaciecola sp.]|jgi:hypothetical protein